MRENNIREIFKIGVFLKALTGIFEGVGGVILLFSSQVGGWVNFLVQGELLEDPGDAVALTVHQYLPYFSGGNLFAAYYLLIHSAVNLFLAVSLLRNKLWAYPSAIVIFIIFIMYQTYHFVLAPSLFLFALTAFDIFIALLTWHEYRIVK